MNGTGTNFDYLKISGFPSPISLSSKRIDNLLNKENIHYADKRLQPNEWSAHTVYLAHVTRDIVVEDIPTLLQKIIHIPFRGVTVRPYKNSKNGKLQSIVIMSAYRRRKAGKNLYLTLYDKFEESGQERYRNVLRIEQKICTFSEIRSSFMIESNDLCSVLNSEHDPIKTTLQRFQLRIDNDAKKTFVVSDFNQRLYEAYFKMFDFEWSAIEQDMKLYGKSTYHIRKANRIFIEMVSQKEIVNFKEVFDCLLKRI